MILLQIYTFHFVYASCASLDLYITLKKVFVLDSAIPNGIHSIEAPVLPDHPRAETVDQIGKIILIAGGVQWLFLDGG